MWRNRRQRGPVVMLLENQPYPADVRVRSEAEALVRCGHMVKVIAPRARGEPKHEQVHGVTVSRYRLPPGHPGIIGLLLEYAVANVQLHLRGLLELARGARVLHIHNPPDTLFPVAWAARLTGARVVFDHHDLAPELFSVKFGGRPRVAMRALQAIERLTLRSADHVLAANESHRAAAISRAGVSPDAITVVRNGPPLRALAPNGTRPGSLSEPRLVFVGSMADQDGIVDLADIVAELECRHGLRASLWMIGDGPSRGLLSARSAELGIAARISFTGRVPPEQVPSLLAAADICLDPAPCNSFNHCSTMVKIAEYLAAGRPVVAYRLRETVRTAGELALLADCGDRSGFVDNIATLARDGELRAKLGRRGRERARELAWEHSERALIGAYGQL